jgi:hypothetical protein
MLQTYVSGASDVCCKCFVSVLQSRSECCICCNGYTRMFQVYVLNVSSSDVCCKYFYLDVAKVDLDVAYTSMLQVYFSNGLRCFIHLLQAFHLDVCNGF